MLGKWHTTQTYNNDGLTVLIMETAEAEQLENCMVRKKDSLLALGGGGAVGPI